MVPLLLLLLGLGTQAIEVSFSVLDSGSSVQLILPNIEVHEARKGFIRCRLVGLPCVLLNQSSSFISLGRANESLSLTPTLIKGPVPRTDFQNRNMSFSLYLCQNILTYVEELYHQTAGMQIFRHLLYIRDACIDFFLSNNAAKTSYIEVERDFIHNIMELVSVDDQVTYTLRRMSISLLRINNSTLSSAGLQGIIPLDLPALVGEDATLVPSIQLPVSGLQAIPEEKRLIGLVTYRDANQFQLEEEVFQSRVIRIEVLREYDLRNLTESIKMIFPIAPINDTNVTEVQCQFLDETDLRWKTDGCHTSTIDQNSILCSCDHATPFSVLLIRQPIGRVHWEILSYISYIGCGLSAFFTSLSLVIFVFRRSSRMDYSISIHVSLSGALLLLNGTFLLTEWGATVELAWVCVLVAALMHYSLLCCFTWMAVEALHLYLLLVKVFNTYYKRYMLKLSLIGWGLPAIIVGASLGVKDFKQFYGVTEMAFSDSNRTSAMCWITDQSFFYALNLVYFTLIFIFNTGILMTVACGICRMKRAPKPTGTIETARNTWTFPARLTASCRNGLTVLGLTCLMGTTWGLAFLGAGYINYPILYLFCILNSTQGFFIFLWIVLSVKKQERRAQDEKMSSAPAKTTTTKLE